MPSVTASEPCVPSAAFHKRASRIWLACTAPTSEASSGASATSASTTCTPWLTPSGCHLATCSSQPTLPAELEPTTADVLARGWAGPRQAIASAQIGAQRGTGARNQRFGPRRVHGNPSAKGAGRCGTRLKSSSARPTAPVRRRHCSSREGHAAGGRPSAPTPTTPATVTPTVRLARSAHRLYHVAITLRHKQSRVACLLCGTRVCYVAHVSVAARRYSGRDKEPTPVGTESKAGVGRCFEGTYDSTGLN